MICLELFCVGRGLYLEHFDSDISVRPCEIIDTHKRAMISAQPKIHSSKLPQGNFRPYAEAKFQCGEVEIRASRTPI